MNRNPTLRLAEAQRAHYLLTGDRAALDEAIELARGVVAELPEGHRDVADASAGLASSLLVRLGHSHEPAEVAAAVEEALAASDAAVAATPRRHPGRGIRLCTLSSAWLARYERNGRDRNDLDDAVRWADAALAATLPDHRDRAAVLANKATVLRHVYEMDRSATAMLEEAAELWSAAVDRTPPDDPRRAPRLAELALVLAELGTRGPEAVRVAGMAAAITHAAPPTRLRALQALGTAAADEGRWTDAAAAFGEAIRLLPLAAPRNLTRGDLEHRLRTLGNLAGNAAAAALETHDAETALESLEHGRATLLSYALDARQGLTELRAVDGELAEEWERLRDHLDGVTTATDPYLRPDIRARLSEEQEELTRRVQQRTAGATRFLAPPTLAQMSHAAHEGPLISLNISRIRCDALVLTEAGVREVPLSRQLAEDAAQSQLDAFLDATETSASGDRQSRAEARMRDVLAWLWDVAVGPVLEALGLTRPPGPGEPWPRVWWAPTGPLAFLPLHAAGHHADGGPAAIDRVVSSYTPSIRALTYARRPRSSPDARRALAISVPYTPGQDLLTLQSASQEAQRVADLLGGTARPSPTRDEVLAALPWATHSHFACHATVDPNSPSDSHVLLWDGPLSVADISSLDLDQAELAYLSACSTARGEVRLANESIHMASAFQLAGYRHVIATLWPILDDEAERLASDFYDQVRRAVPPSTALHSAVRSLRRRTADTPSVWAAYMHVGA